MDNHKKKLITHNGTFHADDLFACATLALVMENENMQYEIIRTRDLSVIKNGDYVFDVGGEYNPNTNRYDHHQRNGAGARDNGIPYASFGLVWKHFGQKLCSGNMDAWKIIDEEIASPIDANDNGIDIGDLKFKDVKPYAGSRVFTIFEPTWKEDINKTDDIFTEQVKKAISILKREIKVALDDAEGKAIIKSAYEKAENKRIIFLEISFPRYLYQSVLSSFPEPIYLVYPSGHGSSWKVEAISKSPGVMESRKPFPESWRGFIRSEENLTASIEGIEGILFIHNSGFLANLDSKEHAIMFAEKALKI